MLHAGISCVVIEPGLAERIHRSLKAAAQVQEKTYIPLLYVLSYNEIASDKQFKIVATVGQLNFVNGNSQNRKNKQRYAGVLMKIKRYTGADMCQSNRKLRNVLDPNMVLLSNRAVAIMQDVGIGAKVYPPSTMSARVVVHAHG